MKAIDDILGQLQGTEVRVTSALPFMARNEEGENLGPVHWFPMYDFIWVSQEFYDKLKALDGPSGKLR